MKSIKNQKSLIKLFMKKGMMVIPGALLLMFYFISCNSGSSAGDQAIATDSATIALGESLFTQNCSGCHNFMQDAIGPQLGGVTSKFSPVWIKNFIKNSQELVASGDKQAQQLVKKYKTIMPSFLGLKEHDLNAILAFIHTHQSPGQPVAEENGKAIADPIPAKIPFSNLVINLEEFTQMPASNDVAPKARITKLSYQPGSGDLFINDLRGKLYKLKGEKPIVYMDMAKLKPKFINEPGLATGFGSFAFHPGFSKNGLLYTTHTEAPGSGKPDFNYNDSIKVTVQWVLTEWKAKDPFADTFLGTSRELLRINMVTGIHGVQEITFNPLAKPGSSDYGMLYIGVGDGGSVETVHPYILKGNKTIWGSILRIDPSGRNSSNGQYGIPADNPFVKKQNTGALGEIYAYGFRNPHRITWSKFGNMLACNIGQTNIESLNLIKPGHNYGWPFREGSFAFDPYSDLNKVYPLPGNDSINKITYPIAEFDHDDGNAISGGYEYWGTRVPLLNGKFIFGDIPSGKLFYIEMADIKQGQMARIKELKMSINGTIKTFKELCGPGRVDLHFGRDKKGEMYLLTKADGKVYKIVGADTIVP